MKIPKKLKYLVQNDFLIGFEIECVFSSQKISNEDLDECLNKIHRRIIFEDDGSISYKADEFSAEIKTPPLPSNKAFHILFQIFDLIKRFGRTNVSTGFHVNISLRSKKLHSKINPFFLVDHPLFYRIAKKFKRNGNAYCRPVRKNSLKIKISSAIELWKNFANDEGETLCLENTNAFNEKGTAINLNYLYPVRNRDSRIEVRAMGNTDYHLRFKEICFYVNQTIKVIKQSTQVSTAQSLFRL